MQVDGQALPDTVIERIEQTQQRLVNQLCDCAQDANIRRLSSTRRKRPVPDDWVTPDTLQTFDVSQTSDGVASSDSFLAVDSESGHALLASGTDAIIYSTTDGQTTSTLQCGAKAVAGTWWNGKAIIALTNGSIKVFENDQEIATLSKHAGTAIAVQVHPCGDILASIGADKSFVLYDLQTFAPLTQQFTGSDLSSAAFHPDGHLLATGTVSGEIKLFDVKTLENIHTFPPSTPTAVTAMSFSENGTWLATVSANSSAVTVWDLRKTAQLKTIDLGVPLTSVAWDYTGQFLAVSGPSCITVQHYAKASKAWSEPLRKATDAQQLGWGANGQKLVTVSSAGTVAVLSA